MKIWQIVTGKDVAKMWYYVKISTTEDPINRGTPVYHKTNEANQSFWQPTTTIFACKGFANVKPETIKFHLEGMSIVNEYSDARNMKNSWKPLKGLISSELIAFNVDNISVAKMTTSGLETSPTIFVQKSNVYLT